MKIFFCAGESSGDQLAAELIIALKQQTPSCQIVGLGSTAMQRAGMELLYDMSRTASIGLIESLAALLPGLSALRRAKRLLHKERPDLLVVVDCPGINVPLVRYANKLRVPVVYFVPPQYYIWQGEKKGRQVVARVALFLNIYQMGYDFYSRLGGNCLFVGHPVVDQVKRAAAKSTAKADNQNRIVALVPGTRRQELKRLLPLFAESAETLYAEDKNLTFLVPVLNKDENIVNKTLSEYHFPFSIVKDDFYAVLRSAEFVITKSGTAALQTAVCAVPYLVVYRVAALSAFVFRCLLGFRKKRFFISLPNIITGKQLAVELVQTKATASNIVAESKQLLYDKKKRENFCEGISSFCNQLGDPGVAERAAEALLRFMNN